MKQEVGGLISDNLYLARLPLAGADSSVGRLAEFENSRGVDVEGIELAVIRVLFGLVLWPLRFVCWSGSSRLITSKAARRLKFADRTFSTKGRERVANRSGGSCGTANAAPDID